MGKLGEEVSQKIKYAIKAKLMELGIHIDNELPDYVMVLVANKKSQEQMEDDLSLFLGESTKTFTSWLHSVLKKLEQFTISTKAKKKEKTRRKSLVDYDSNGVTSTKKFKSENMEETVKEERDDGAPGVKTVSSPVHEDDIEKEDALSLTDNTEVGNCAVNEAQSTVDEDHKRNDKTVKSLEDARPRERIKIVWDKEKTEGGDRAEIADGKNIKNRVSKSEKGEPMRSRSRSRLRHSSKRKSNRGSSHERSRSRHKSRERHSRKSSSSPRRKITPERKVVDARDILKRKGAAKKMSSIITRKGSRSPHRRSTRSKSKEPPREQKLSSVLKAVISCPEKPPPSIPSLVKVTPRPVRPPSMQPNCNLILKAVADAEKSLATSKVNKRKPKENFEENKAKKDRKRYDYASKGNISITLLNDRVVASKLGVPVEVYQKDDVEEWSQDEDSEKKVENEASQDINNEDTMSMALDADDFIDSFEKDEQYNMEPPPRPSETFQAVIQEAEEPDKKRRFIISLDSTASDNEVETDLEVSKQNCEISDDVSSTTVEPVVEKKPEKRQFDRSRLGPKIPISTSSISTTVSGRSSQIPDTLTEVTASLTRCKYWPCCEAGDTCSYFHPTTLCRSFPNCHFGEKCLYIHPACKFADNCLNTKCPYAHTSTTPAANTPSRSFLPMSTSQALCIYYPNCTKSFCPYVHIKKPCRFGSSCMKMGCEFDHGTSKNPYKWVAI